MANGFTLEELKKHPFAIYVQESLQARNKVGKEITRLENLIDDASLSEDERIQARNDLSELTSQLGLMDEADQAFIARVVLGPFPPRDEVVERTVELNKNLGQVVADANRAQAIIRLVAQWSNALAAVVTGQAPSMPRTATPAVPTVDAGSP